MEHEIKGDRNKTKSVENNINKITQYLKDIINHFKKSDTLKIQLTIVNNFIFTIDKDEECLMH